MYISIHRPYLYILDDKNQFLFSHLSSLIKCVNFDCCCMSFVILCTHYGSCKSDCRVCDKELGLRDNRLLEQLVLTCIRRPGQCVDLRLHTIQNDYDRTFANGSCFVL